MSERTFSGSETGKLDRIEKSPRNLIAFVVLAEFSASVVPSSKLSDQRVTPEKASHTWIRRIIKLTATGNDNQET
jgi:hypothetical protein